jgi:transposase-like protein
MAPKKRRSLRKGNDNISTPIDEQKKTKSPSLRVQLRVLTVPVLKNILRFNHQNPFGNKPVLISRILYLVQHGGYPKCPKCTQGRLKARLHRRKDQSKYFCPGFPLGFRGPCAYHYCDYKTDECEKETFRFPPELHLNF